jgi:hypothetical protein
MYFNVHSLVQVNYKYISYAVYIDQPLFDVPAGLLVSSNDGLTGKGAEVAVDSSGELCVSPLLHSDSEEKGYRGTPTSRGCF